jgi:hypothetical protein
MNNTKHIDKLIELIDKHRGRITLRLSECVRKAILISKGPRDIDTGDLLVALLATHSKVTDNPTAAHRMLREVGIDATALLKGIRAWQKP